MYQSLLVGKFKIVSYTGTETVYRHLWVCCNQLNFDILCLFEYLPMIGRFLRLSRGLHLPGIQCRRYLSFGNMLQPHHTTVVKEESELLSQLYNTVLALDPECEDLNVIKDTLSGIDDLFMVVVVGEFNSGKSTLINSLLGGNFLKTGILPTTSKVCVLRSSSNVESRTWKVTSNVLLKDFEEIDLPVEWLKHIAIVDTPGTNAVIAQHEKITHQVVPRADLILFVTSAERPITETEADFLRKIAKWGKKGMTGLILISNRMCDFVSVLMVVNKMDILSPMDREEVLSFVAQNSAVILGITKPLPVFGVSGRDALNSILKAKKDGFSASNSTQSSSWENGNMQSLERYLLKVLGHQEIIKNKLENPLNVADRVITTSEETISERRRMLDGDERVLVFIEENMAVFMSDMDRDVAHFKHRINSLLDGLIQRADEFFDANVTIMKPKLMLDPKSFQEAFTRDVLTDIAAPIDDIIQDVSDLVAKRAHTQAEAVATYIGTRPSRYAGKILGSGHLPPTDMFTSSRHVLLERLRRDAGEVIRSHDQKKESEQIAKAVTSCMMQIGAVQTVSAASLGALVVAHTLDLTGVVVLSGFAASSLFLLPYRKAAMK